MNKIIKIIFASFGACEVVMDVITPIAIAYFWGSYFGFELFSSKIIMIIGGMAGLFKGFKIGWVKNE